MVRFSPNKKAFLYCAVISLTVLCFLTGLIIFDPAPKVNLSEQVRFLNLYGLSIFLAVLISLLLLSLILPPELKNDSILVSSLWVVTPAILIARIWHVITDFSYYQNDLIQILSIHKGGLSSWGALLGGVIGIYLLSRFKNYNPKLLMNYIATVVPVGVAIGRVGNYFNCELFGPATDKPWGIFIPPNSRPAHLLDEVIFHPTFYYEAVLNIFLFWILLSLLYNNKGANNFLVAAVYLFGYGCIRFYVEFYRLSSDFIEILSLNQVIALLLVFLGIGYIIKVNYELIRSATLQQSRF